MFSPPTASLASFLAFYQSLPQLLLLLLLVTSLFMCLKSNQIKGKNGK